MTNQQISHIKKLIKLNREMLMAEMKHAKATGIRHQPTKTTFKKRRKQKKLLNELEPETLHLILKLILETTDELTKPKGLNRQTLETLTKEEKVDMILNTRYLHEYLSEALVNHQA